MLLGTLCRAGCLLPILAVLCNGPSFADDGVVFGPPHKPATFGAITIAYVSDKAFGLTYPRIIKYPDKAQLEKINAALEKRHRDEVADYRACADGPLGEKQKGPDAVAEYYFNVEYASPRLLSISQHGTNHCGGAHYEQYLLVETYDLSTLAKVGGDYDADATPQGFGQIFKLDSKEERMAFEKFVARSWIAMSKATGEDAGSCAFSEEATGDFQVNLFFTKQGLGVLENDFGYFDTPECAASGSTPTIIPWKQLKPFLKKGQTLLVEEVR